MKVVTSSQELLTIESYEASKSKPSLPVRISAPTTEGTTIMAIKILAPAFLAGAAAAAIILAPSASAATSADCDDDGGASVCTRNGHAAIVATPKPVGGQLMIAPGGSPFGLGPMPPLLAID